MTKYERFNNCNSYVCSACHICINLYTVEPPNKGHVGAKSFVLYREVSFIRRL